MRHSEYSKSSQLIAQLLAGDCSRENVRAKAEARGHTEAEIYNLIALEISTNFLAGNTNYADADYVMNQVSGYLMELALEFGDGFELPEPAWSIYLAFDEGEYNHGGSSNPVSDFTIPKLRGLVSAA